MKKISKILSLLAILSFTSGLLAKEGVAKLEEVLLQRGMQVDAIDSTAIPGLYAVREGSRVFYFSVDGRFLIHGEMYDLISGEPENLTEKSLKSVRKELINTVPENEFIIFKAKNEQYRINIFTDIDCGYCRKLHSEMDDYLAAGITIKYLFFPRAGLASDAYKKAVSVWCADDQNKAITTAKMGTGILENKSCKNPVAAHMKLGEQLGVRGTPMMITETGTVFPGYMPAKQLAKALSLDK
ncbi:MAG: thioredoxin fold domain-containing protein [Methyloprofundus sp.]|nr:thioredoxin fold domain-containing protein [Methyloprofundus sp.]